MRAIVGIESWDEMQARTMRAARTHDSGGEVPEDDYRLNFADAAQLFSELTPARLRLLDRLKAIGPVSIYALAKQLERNYSNVHTDVGRLIELELIEKDAANRVLVPWDAVQIQVTLDGSRAA